MRSSRRQQQAFTLIELLIVVAIIAILALIAVPNFLEAQTRAKVARIKSDLRSLATALEAYCVDWNSYTYRNGRFDNPWDSGAWGGFLPLTTPVAYITTIPLDAFGESSVRGLGRSGCYEMGAGVAGVDSAGPRDNLSPQGFPSNTWMIESDGPDHFDDTIGGPPASPIGGPRSLNYSTGGYPWPNLPDNDATVADVLSLRYDPTNGTISAGEIYRCGGQKGPGRPMEVFFQGSSAH